MKTILLLLALIYYCHCTKLFQDNQHGSHSEINSDQRQVIDDYAIRNSADLSIQAEYQHRKKRGKRFDHSKHEKDHVLIIDSKTHKKNSVLPYDFYHDQ